MSDTKSCPDCYDYASGLSLRGNGRCRKCRGTGDASSLKRAGETALKYITMGGWGIDDECSECSGTGQCQTCGGEGWVYE